MNELLRVRFESTVRRKPQLHTSYMKDLIEGHLDSREGQRRVRQARLCLLIWLTSGSPWVIEHEIFKRFTCQGLTLRYT